MGEVPVPLALGEVVPPPVLDEGVKPDLVLDEGEKPPVLEEGVHQLQVVCICLRDENRLMLHRQEVPGGRVHAQLTCSRQQQQQ